VLPPEELPEERLLVEEVPSAPVVLCDEAAVEVDREVRLEEPPEVALLWVDVDRVDDEPSVVMAAVDVAAVDEALEDEEPESVLLPVECFPEPPDERLPAPPDEELELPADREAPVDPVDSEEDAPPLAEVTAVVPDVRVELAPVELAEDVAADEEDEAAALDDVVEP
jgi:hypothetical protein